MAESGTNSSMISSLSGRLLHNIEWETRLPWRSLVVFLAAVAAVASYFWLHSLSRRNRPGPKSWPLIGALPVLLPNWERMLDFMLEYFDKGDDAIWLCLMFGEEGIYIAEPSLIEHVLKTNFANYPKGLLVTEHHQEFLGHGIFNSDHEQWRVQRKVASLEFSSANLRDWSTAVYRDHAVKVIRLISEFCESNRTMDLQDLFLRMTLDSTAKLAFGLEMGCLSSSLPEVPFANAFERANELCVHRYIDPLWKIKKYLNIGTERELRGCVKVMESLTYDVIRQRREEMETAVVSTTVKAKPDVLSRFMALQDGSNGAYSDIALRDVVLNFIIAGRDTVGLTLSWFFYRMCLHPEVAKKVLAEVTMLEPQDEISKEEEESGDKYTRFADLLTYQNMGKMHYLHAVLSETLRLHPAVPLDGKTAIADDILPNGAPVKKGMMITYCSYALGRLERVWGPDAKEFRPERWLKDGIFQPESPFKFIAFHAGPRACMGKDSAYLQMKMTAALVMRFFDFLLVPGHEVTYRMMLVLTMNKGLKVMGVSR